MGTKGLRGESLFDKFEDVLRSMGIVLEVDDTGYDGNQSQAQHTLHSVVGVDQRTEVLDHRTNEATHGIRRRRASFNSIYDVGEDATQRSAAFRPSSRSSMSRLQVGKPEFAEIEGQPAHGFRRERAKSLDRSQMLAQFLEMGRRLMGGLDPLKEPDPNPDGVHLNGNITPKTSLPVVTNGHLTSSSSRESRIQSSSNSSLQSGTPSPKIGKRPQIDNINMIDEMEMRPSLSDLLRDASTFASYRKRAAARDILVQWSETAVRLQQSQRAMEIVAISKDRGALLRQAFDVWRTALQKKRQNVHTQRFFKHLERRAARARDLYLMTKAFTHWAQLTSEEISRTSAARQHVLGIKYFHAWQEITAVNELKAQRFSMKRPLDSWTRKFIQLKEADSTAAEFSTANLKRKHVTKWYWNLYFDRRAPEWNDYRLKRRSLICWIRALRTQRERDNDIDHHNRRELLHSVFKTWVERLHTIGAAQNEADSIHAKKILRIDLDEWRVHARLSSAATQVFGKVDRRVLQTAFGNWKLRTQASQQAKQVDRLRVIRNAWTTWNDRLRCRALNARIDERLKLETIYKWVLAERFRLAQRIRDQRIQRETFSTFIVTARNVSRELIQREEQYLCRRDVGLLRSILHGWRDKLTVQRQREYMASEFYAPRVEQEAMTIWTSRHLHIAKHERWAKDARFYFLATKFIKQWHKATVDVSKKRRQDAYMKVRRKIKMNLASSALSLWQAKAQRVIDIGHQAEQIRREKLRVLVSDLFTQWQQKAAKITQDLQDAEVYYHRQVAYHLLSSWVERSKKYQTLEEQAEGLDILHVSGLASAQLRKLSLRIFQVRSQSEMADGMHERILRKHYRNIIRHWVQRMKAQREAHGAPGPTVTEGSVSSVTGSLEPTTPGPAVLPEVESTFNLSELMSLPDRQLLSTTPIATPGYLTSPSRRAARARMLAQMSTTPATPLYTPFASRLRAAATADRGTVSHTQSRRSSVGTMVRFAIEEPESPSEGRRSTRREL
jgi:protein SFI1